MGPARGMLGARVKGKGEAWLCACGPRDAGAPGAGDQGSGWMGTEGAYASWPMEELKGPRLPAAPFRDATPARDAGRLRGAKLNFSSSFHGFLLILVLVCQQPARVRRVRRTCVREVGWGRCINGGGKGLPASKLIHLYLRAPASVGMSTATAPDGNDARRALTPSCAPAAPPWPPPPPPPLSIGLGSTPGGPARLSCELAGRWWRLLGERTAANKPWRRCPMLPRRATGPTTPADGDGAVPPSARRPLCSRDGGASAVGVAAADSTYAVLLPDTGAMVPDTAPSCPTDRSPRDTPASRLGRTGTPLAAVGSGPVLPPAAAGGDGAVPPVTPIPRSRAEPAPKAKSESMSPVPTWDRVEDARTKARWPWGPANAPPLPLSVSAAGEVSRWPSPDRAGGRRALRETLLTGEARCLTEMKRRGSRMDPLPAAMEPSGERVCGERMPVLFRDMMAEAAAAPGVVVEGGAAAAAAAEAEAGSLPGAGAAGLEGAEVAVCSMAR